MFVDQMTLQLKQHKGQNLTKEELESLITKSILALNQNNSFENISKHLSDLDIQISQMEQTINSSQLLAEKYASRMIWFGLGMCSA